MLFKALKVIQANACTTKFMSGYKKKKCNRSYISLHANANECNYLASYTQSDA